jgi:epoxyqueuosine reductase
VTLTEQIRKEARALGIDKIGIARATALEAEGAHLREWLGRGFQGTMSWMSRTAGKRADLQTVLPGARSVISCALNYYTPWSHAAEPSLGKISRYAWGDDYHDVLGRKLEALAAAIGSAAPEANTRAYVDTGPVMEKAWAERAGVGWIGKHGNIITQELGSWVFLGEIITDLVLEYDTPETDQCGSCTLCIEACPTQAIAEPYVVDANRCISYLTIEHHGQVDHPLEGWVYGCDVCQDVCPWNSRGQRATSEAAFQPREANKAPALAELAEITQEEFSSRFRKSPVKRTKRAGLRRNAKINIDHAHKEQ